MVISSQNNNKGGQALLASIVVKLHYFSFIAQNNKTKIHNLKQSEMKIYFGMQALLALAGKACTPKLNTLQYRHRLAVQGTNMNLDQLSALAGKFKGFLAIVAFMILAALVLFGYLFSAGSFDFLIQNFAIFTKDQFFVFVMAVGGGIFIISLLLIILAYRSTKPTEKTAELKTPDSIRIIVYKHGRRSDFVEGALVNLAPENKGSTQQKISNAHGSVEFDIPTATHELKFYISASKENHQASEEKHITVKTGENNPFAIELNPN